MVRRPALAVLLVLVVVPALPALSATDCDIGNSNSLCYEEEGEARDCDSGDHYGYNYFHLDHWLGLWVQVHAYEVCYNIAGEVRAAWYHGEAGSGANKVAIDYLEQYHDVTGTRTRSCTLTVAASVPGATGVSHSDDDCPPVRPWPTGLAGERLPDDWDDPLD